MDNFTYEAVNKYFNHLSKVGYFKQSEVNKLILLLFIQEFIYGDCNNFLTDQDRKDIEKVLYCLYGSSCLIPYPDNSDRQGKFYGFCIK